MLLGSSGGGQISVGAAAYLGDEIDAPLAVVTFGGVMASDRGIEEVARLASLYGTDDRVYALGRTAFPGRWPLAAGSFWNTARQEHRLTERAIGPMGHSGRGGYLDAGPRPDGAPFLEVTVREVAAAVRTSLAAASRRRPRIPPLDHPDQHRIGQRGIGAGLERIDELVPEPVRPGELEARHRARRAAPRRRRRASPGRCRSRCRSRW